MTSPLEQVAEEAASNTQRPDDDPKVEERVRAGLECPCVSDLRQGPCGQAFTEAFSCYIRSRTDVKGQDCVETYAAFHKCILTHANAFDKYIDENRGEAESKMRATG